MNDEWILVMKLFSFYQNMICPHESSFMRELANRLDSDVTWVVDTETLPYRKKMGLSPPNVGEVKVLASQKEGAIRRLINDCRKDHIHILQGPRGGFSSRVAWRHSLLSASIRKGLFCEPGDHRGIKGLIRRALYRYEAYSWGRGMDFILTTGSLGEEWYVKSGYPKDRIFPFCYVTERPDLESDEIAPINKYRIVFCGQLIRRKRVDLLLISLKEIDQKKWQLIIIGNGPEQRYLFELAKKFGLEDSIEWLGSMENSKALSIIGKSDLLVLPSSFDGWGAVVSESIMAGTPAICSSSCGSADILRDDWRGSVFVANNSGDLTKTLNFWIEKGKVSLLLREKIKRWAEEKISGFAVANYFLKIMEHVYGQEKRPIPPWRE